jgi:prophage antirepressor-like protein
MKLKVFENVELGSIRVMEKDGDVWFVAKDIADILDIGNVSQALTRLDDDERNTIILNEGIGNPEKSIVNESGLYSLVLSSRKPEAKAFKKWVTSEVLPSIRKNGGYIAGQESMSSEEIIANALIVANNVIKEKQRLLDEAIRTKSMISDKKVAQAMNTASQAVKKVHKLEIELDRSKEYRTIKGMISRHEGFDFDWRLLKKESQNQNKAIIKVFDSNYGEVSSYHKDVWDVVYPNFFQE